MNESFDQKKMSGIEEALKLKDEGKRLPYIAKKFPNCESEIREIFGTVAFLKENAEKIVAPINIFKTMLSKMPSIASVQPETRPKKEIERADDNAYVPETRHYEDAKNDGLPIFESLESENDNTFGKWKIIAPVIILAVITGIILLKSDSKIEKNATKEDVGARQIRDDLISIPNAGIISSSTEKVKKK